MSATNIDTQMKVYLDQATAEFDPADKIAAEFPLSTIYRRWRQLAEENGIDDDTFFTHPLLIDFNGRMVREEKRVIILDPNSPLGRGCTFPHVIPRSIFHKVESAEGDAKNKSEGEQQYIVKTVLVELGSVDGTPSAAPIIFSQLQVSEQEVLAAFDQAFENGLEAAADPAAHRFNVGAGAGSR